MPGGGEQEAREDGGEDQPVDAVRLHRRGDEHDEGAGRAADLEAAAAEGGDAEAADDRGVEPALGRRARGDGDRHRQRQRHDRHREAGEEVGTELARAVALGERRHELRQERGLRSGGLVNHSRLVALKCAAIVHRPGPRRSKGRLLRRFARCAAAALRFSGAGASRTERRGRKQDRWGTRTIARSRARSSPAAPRRRRRPPRTRRPDRAEPRAGGPGRAARRRGRSPASTSPSASPSAASSTSTGARPACAAPRRSPRARSRTSPRCATTTDGLAIVQSDVQAAALAGTGAFAAAGAVRRARGGDGALSRAADPRRPRRRRRRRRRGSRRQAGLARARGLGDARASPSALVAALGWTDATLRRGRPTIRPEDVPRALCAGRDRRLLLRRSATRPGRSRRRRPNCDARLVPIAGGAVEALVASDPALVARDDPGRPLPGHSRAGRHLRRERDARHPRERARGHHLHHGPGDLRRLRHAARPRPRARRPRPRGDGARGPDGAAPSRARRATTASAAGSE